MDVAEFNKLISDAAAVMPPASVQQPENLLSADPVLNALRQELKLQNYRIADIERFLEGQGYERCRASR